MAPLFALGFEIFYPGWLQTQDLQATASLTSGCLASLPCCFTLLAGASSSVAQAHGWAKPLPCFCHFPWHFPARLLWEILCCYSVTAESCHLWLLAPLRPHSSFLLLFSLHPPPCVPSSVMGRVLGGREPVKGPRSRWEEVPYLPQLLACKSSILPASSV